MTPPNEILSAVDTSDQIIGLYCLVFALFSKEWLINKIYRIQVNTVYCENRMFMKLPYVSETSNQR